MELKPEIKYDDFEKLDIRVGTITKCEKQENAERLLIFQVDFGEFTRQIVSSIAMYYKPEELVGKQVCAIVNFKPRLIRGIESNGMLLCAENEEDTMLSLVTTMAKIKDGLFVG
jgi:methionyl-tRNA synthetase C-terminal region/beta chain